MVAGLTLLERAVLSAHRLDLAPIRLWGPTHLSAEVRRRLATHGVGEHDLTQAPTIEPSTFDDGEHVVVIGPDALVEPKALDAMVREALDSSLDRVIVTRDSAGPLMAFVPASRVRSLVESQTPWAVAAPSSASDPAERTPPAAYFCRRVSDHANLSALAGDYARHLNGPRESFFTRIIRRFSVPLSLRLATLGLPPTLVTLAGLLFAAAAAVCIATGTYLGGLCGAVLYYSSMVLDCSDGEVARLSFRDSAFGAWFETVVDYSTYLLLLLALAVSGPGEGGSGPAFRLALLVALGGSIVVIAVASYLRYRVAANDPGEFDEASARELKRSSSLHRFARWGRQWIKRSTMAHLLVALALAGRLPLLVYLWACGAAVAAAVIAAVGPFVVRRVRVRPVGLTGS